MEQQLWCWGRDVEFSDGNLLMDFGFERHRDQGIVERSTCYRLDNDELHVCMWGFGLFFGRRELGGIYIHRFDFSPKWAPIESLALAIHWPAELPVFVRPSGQDQWRRARILLKALTHWIACYETWVRDTVGVAYRRDCVETWLRPFVRADRMSLAWRFLSRRGWERQGQSLPNTLNRYTIS